MAETVDLFVPLGELDEPLEPRLERALGWAAGRRGRSACCVDRSTRARAARSDSACA
jgi:hypothetical protein